MLLLKKETKPNKNIVICIWKFLGQKLLILEIYLKSKKFGLLGRVFAKGPGDLGSIPARVLPKILKMVIDTSLLNTQQYKVRIKGKVEESREKSSALPYISVL